MTPVWAQRLAWVLWPSFLMAALAEIAFFALVDPSEILLLGEPLHADRLAVYTVGFFGFWVFAAVSSALTLLLAATPVAINRGGGVALPDSEPGQTP